MLTEYWPNKRKVCGDLVVVFLRRWHFHLWDHVDQLRMLLQDICPVQRYPHLFPESQSCKFLLGSYAPSGPFTEHDEGAARHHEEGACCSFSLEIPYILPITINKSGIPLHARISYIFNKTWLETNYAWGRLENYQLCSNKEDGKVHCILHHIPGEAIVRACELEPRAASLKRFPPKNPKKGMTP